MKVLIGFTKYIALIVLLYATEVISRAAELGQMEPEAQKLAGCEAHQCLQ